MKQPAAGFPHRGETSEAIKVPPLGLPLHILKRSLAATLRAAPILMLIPTDAGDDAELHPVRLCTMNAPALPGLQQLRIVLFKSHSLFYSAFGGRASVRSLTSPISEMNPKSVFGSPKLFVSFMANAVCHSGLYFISLAAPATAIPLSQEPFIPPPGEARVGLWQVPAVPIRGLAAGERHSLVLSDKGVVHGFGWGQSGECDTGSLKDVTAVCAGNGFTAALLEGGSVVTLGDVTGAELLAGRKVSQFGAGSGWIAGIDENGELLAPRPFIEQAALPAGFVCRRLACSPFGGMVRDAAGVTKVFGEIPAIPDHLWEDAKFGEDLVVTRSADGFRQFGGWPALPLADCRDIALQMWSALVLRKDGALLEVNRQNGSVTELFRDPGALTVMSWPQSEGSAVVLRDDGKFRVAGNNPHGMFSFAESGRTFHALIQSGSADPWFCLQGKSLTANEDGGGIEGSRNAFRAYIPARLAETARLAVCGAEQTLIVDRDGHWYLWGRRCGGITRNLKSRLGPVIADGTCAGWNNDSLYVLSPDSSQLLVFNGDSVDEHTLPIPGPPPKSLRVLLGRLIVSDDATTIVLDALTAALELRIDEGYRDVAWIRDSFFWAGTDGQLHSNGKLPGAIAKGLAGSPVQTCANWGADLSILLKDGRVFVYNDQLGTLVQRLPEVKADRVFTQGDGLLVLSRDRHLLEFNSLGLKEAAPWWMGRRILYEKAPAK